MKLKIPKTILFIASLLACLSLYSLQPVRCETGIFAAVSSAAASDNIPLLWINYESDSKDIALCFFHGPLYDFTGLIQNQDTTRVFMGLNTAGFALVYTSTAYTAADSFQNHSLFLKKALGNCGSIADFEELLVDHQAGANLGCLDAGGGCALYEMCQQKIIKYDVNDSGDAPASWLVRENFSFTCKDSVKGNAWRYHRVNNLLQQAAKTQKLDHKYLLQNVARDLRAQDCNPYPLPFTGKYRIAPTGYINTIGTINQRNTTVCVVIQGATNAGKASLATLWIIPGEPVCGIAVPIWPQSGQIPKELSGSGISNLNRELQENQTRLYHKKNWPEYLDSQTLASGKEGMLTVFLKQENEILRETADFQETFSINPGNFRQLENFQKKMVYKAIKTVR